MDDESFKLIKHAFVQSGTVDENGCVERMRVQALFKFLSITDVDNILEQFCHCAEHFNLDDFLVWLLYGEEHATDADEQERTKIRPMKEFRSAIASNMEITQSDGNDFELLRRCLILQINKVQLKVPQILTVEQLTSFETYIFACSGVIWGIADEDKRTSVATINKLLALEKRVMFVTNNANKTRAAFASELVKSGVDFGSRGDEEKQGLVVSASFTTAKYLKENNLKYPFVITSETGILEELRLAGITGYYATIADDGKPRPEFESPLLLDEHQPGIDKIIEDHSGVDCIVVGWDQGITARKLATAINFIQWHEDLSSADEGYCQLPIISCSGDAGGVLGEVSYRGQPRKLYSIGNGAMADTIARSFDPPLVWLDMGKPSDDLIDLLRSPAGYDVNVDTALLVGDTLQTDMVMGRRAGMKTLLVMTGVTAYADLHATLANLKNERRWPDFVLPKLGSLLHALA